MDGDTVACRLTEAMLESGEGSNAASVQYEYDINVTKLDVAEATSRDLYEEQVDSREELACARDALEAANVDLEAAQEVVDSHGPVIAGDCKHLLNTGKVVRVAKQNLRVARRASVEHECERPRTGVELELVFARETVRTANDALVDAQQESTNEQAGEEEAVQTANEALVDVQQESTNEQAAEEETEEKVMLGPVRRRFPPQTLPRLPRSCQALTPSPPEITRARFPVRPVMPNA